MKNGSSVERSAERASRRASPWIKRLARAGYVSYGVVFALVGVLAVQAALGAGGKTASQEGALRQILLAPLGRVLLGAVVIGLLGYAMWRLIQSILDPENEGTDAKGLARRVDHVLNGLFHAALASRGVVFGVIGAFLVQAALRTDPDEARGLGGALETLADQPFDPYLLGAVALGLVAYGAFMFVVARYRRIAAA